MPIFEYRCNACGTDFEVLMASGTAPSPCDRCGSTRVEKQFSTFSAGMSNRTQMPCTDGGCPSTGMAGSGCSTGGCPYSQS